MRAIAHPDDPRPLREQFARAYSRGRVVPTSGNMEAVRAPNVGAWRPACWHKPLDRWWGARGLPILPLPVEERWPTFGPNTRGGRV